MEDYMSDDKIAALVDRAKYKDKEAITALIHEVHPQVIARLSYCGIYQEDLKETSRQVYIRAFRSLDTLDNPEDFRHWILQIAEAEAERKKQTYVQNEPDPMPEEPPVREEKAPAEAIQDAEFEPVQSEAEKKSSMVVPIVIIALVAIALIAALIGTRAFGNKKGGSPAVLRDEPAETVEELEKALNELDEKAIIACFDSESRGKYSEEKEEVHEWIVTIGSFLKMTGIAPKFDLETVAVDYKDDEHCDAKVKISYSWIGIEDSDEMTVPMVLEGTHWYILADKFAEDFDTDDLPEDLF